MERPVTVLRVAAPDSSARPVCARCTGGQVPGVAGDRASQARATRPTRRASMRRLLVLGAAVAAACSAVLLLAASATGQQTQTIYIGMDAPLTGPTAVVGQGDREAVNALVNFWNRGRAFKNRRIQVDILDNARVRRRPSKNVQRFVADPKYVAILGSGNAGAAIATAPLATAQIPFLRCRHPRRSSSRLVPTSTSPFRPDGCTPTAWLSTSRARTSSESRSWVTTAASGVTVSPRSRRSRGRTASRSPTSSSSRRRRPASRPSSPE